VRDMMRFAVTRFEESKLRFGQGTRDSLDDALAIVCGSINLPYEPGNYEKLEMFYDSRVTMSEKNLIFEHIKQRIVERKPAAYIVKRAVFGDLDFYVDERVIIPRSYLAEILAEENKEQLSAELERSLEDITSVLDMCTGSGYLAILAAYTFPNATIDAVDISADALEVAKINVTNYELEDRITLIQSDLFKSLQGKKYDIIIANPPYVSTKKIETLPPEFQHEPKIAFHGGDDGLHHIREIIKFAPQHLKKDGFVIVECSGHSRDEIQNLFPNLQMKWIPTSCTVDEIVAISERAYKLAKTTKQNTKPH
jgi:ribosomal protein L3 glutamine methyltransferase